MPKLKRLWITKGILKSINRKNKLYKRSLKLQVCSIIDSIRKIKNKLTSVIRYSKHKYYHELFSSVQGDIKKLRHVNSILGNKKKHHDLPNKMYLENIKLSSEQDIANQFNSYFVNIGKNLSKSISNPSHSKFQDYFSSQNLE